MWQAGASYTFSNFSVGAQYETQDNAGFNDDHEYEAWGITGKATFGNNAISAVYTMSETEDSNGNTTSDTDGWGVSAEHNFSKRTKAYVAYASGEEDVTDSEDDRFSIGLIHNFYATVRSLRSGTGPSGPVFRVGNGLVLSRRRDPTR